MMRDINKVDDTIITAKRLIKQKLYSDSDIIEVLNNPNLNPEEPDSYVGKNIFDYIRIPGTITEPTNYICFDIKQNSIAQYNYYVKEMYYIFNVYVHQDNIDTPYGMSRHDLLGYLIRDIFNYSNFMGNQLELKSDTPGIMDEYSSSRSLIFKTNTTNSLNRAVRTNKYEFSDMVEDNNGF